MERDTEWKELFNKVVAAYWMGREPEPSAYLCALWDEGVKTELKAELERLNEGIRNDPN